jgi:NAD(P)H-dependent flavin oxidoreductase YrpB (nitropropane dioxygenase family)
MMHLSDARWPAAISEAGALGVIGSAMVPDKASFRPEVHAMRQLTRSPFAVTPIILSGNEPELLRGEKPFQLPWAAL